MKYFKYVLKKTCEISGNTVLYNTLTRDLYISKTSTLENENIRQQLFNRGFLIDNDLNDYDIASYYLRSLKYQTDWASFFLFVTSKCNFNCHYCFAPKDHNSWSGKDCANAVRFINKIAKSKNIDFINIYILGGEPLLNVEAIQLFNACFEENLSDYDKRHKKILITNGYYLNKETVRRLKELNIISAQITLDGDERCHNKIRKNQSKGSYKTILANIEHASDEMEIFVRVNVTVATLSSLASLLDDLMKLGTKIKKIIISPVIETNQAPLNFENSLLKNEISNYLLLNNIIKDYGLEPVFPGQGACPEFFERSYSISSNGEIFTCPCFVGNKQLAVGSITNTAFESNYPSFISYERWQDCRQCEFMIMCLGGCRYSAFMQNHNPNSIYCLKDLLHAISNQMLEQKIQDYVQ